MSGDESLRRFDIVAQTRRRWRREEKLAIVAQASGSCTNISAVARRHGIKPALLYRWKKEFGNDQSASSSPTFVPVTIGPNGTGAKVQPRSAVLEPSPAYDTDASSSIEIMLANGRRLRADASVEPQHLKRIIDALEG